MEKVAKRTASVAWFNLALLVNRGEKEKALSLLRLLSYSIENGALALQLEGDILNAFEDREAVVKYREAAMLYKKEQKVTSAISLYEYLIKQDPNNYLYASALLELYTLLNWKEKIAEYKALLAQMPETERTLPVAK